MALGLFGCLGCGGTAATSLDRASAVSGPPTSDSGEPQPDAGTSAPSKADSAVPPTTSGGTAVTIQKQGSTFELLRGGQPYYIQGAGWNGGDTAEIALAAQMGANSLRTWGIDGTTPGLLDTAQEAGMTVMLGIWLAQDAGSYTASYVSTTQAQIESWVNQFKGHGATLFWALGNEIDPGATAAWQFVDQMAKWIHQQDPNHPVGTVIAATGTEPINDVIATASHLDFIGLNAYGAIGSVEPWVSASNFNGPYISSEWGVNGDWEVQNTSWGRPVEPTSAGKVTECEDHYTQGIAPNKARDLGSYVFLWGQKQEATPTWFSMFVESIPQLELAAQSCPTVDAMQYMWKGSWPANRAPNVTDMQINGQQAAANVTLSPSQAINATVSATDPDGDAITYSWEMLEEPAPTAPGATQARPPTVGSRVAGAATPTLTTTAPPTGGQYRLFAYALDGKGHVGTANVPFLVQ
jgi:hypothetical protein